MNRTIGTIPQEAGRNPDLIAVQSAWQDIVHSFVRDDPGRSVLVYGRGVKAAAAEDVSRPAASVLKVLVGIALMAADRTGRIDLRETVPIAQLPTSQWPSVLNVLAPTQALSLLEIAGLAMVTSDNRCAEYLVATLGTEFINSTARGLGCEGTKIAVGFSDEYLNDSGRVNLTTAADSGLLLRTLAKDPSLGWLRQAMSNSLLRGRIPAHLPTGTAVAHKTGSLNGVVNDVGIVTADQGEIILCFLTDQQTDPAQTIIDIAECTHQAFLAWENQSHLQDAAC